MATVALIGPDGAGKTTLTRMLMQSRIARFKYLYMGIDIPGSNIALPTARLVQRLRSSERRRSGAAAVARGYARLLHRLGEEWFRQMVSWAYQSRGYVVLYDRHFALDFAPEIVANAEALPLHKRIHGWCLQRLYPLPDLIIYLDAPGELLFARKGELNVAELERRRQGFLRMGARMKGFVRVDASRPLHEVYAEISQLVVKR